MPVNRHDGKNYTFDSAGNLIGEIGSEDYFNRRDIAQKGRISPPGLPLSYDGSVDKTQTLKDFVTELIPALITMRAGGVGKVGESAGAALLRKMGTSFAGGIGADQVLSGFKHRLMDSAVTSGVNTGLGIAAPELMPGMGNVGFEFPGMTSRSTVSRDPTIREAQNIIERSGVGTSLSKRNYSGESKLQSSTATAAGPEMQPGPPVYIPGVGPNGQALFGKIQPGEDIPTGRYLTNSSTNGTTLNSGTGGTQTDKTYSGNSEATANSATNYGDINSIKDREAKGTFGHLIELFKNVRSVPMTNAAGGPRLAPWQSALAGLLANLGLEGSNLPVNQNNK